MYTVGYSLQGGMERLTRDLWTVLGETVNILLLSYGLRIGIAIVKVNNQGRRNT